jgi:O-antigen/teichoic acid export membrane protein
MWQSRTIMRGTDTSVAAAYAARDDKKEWSSYIAYAVPFFIIFGIDAAAMEIDKAIVAAYFSQVELGAYVAMQLLARMPVFFVVGFIEQLVYPIFFQGSRSTNKAELTVASFRNINRIYLGILLLLLVFVGGIYLFREFAVRLLTTEEYVPYAMLLPLLMLAGVVGQSARILQAPALKAIGSRVFVPAKIVQVIVLVGGMIAAIPSFGLYGVAIAANAAAFALVAAIIMTNLYYLRRGAKLEVSDDE